jgi:drug/metabolite transporter (DMT)-like permease
MNNSTTPQLDRRTRLAWGAAAVLFIGAFLVLTLTDSTLIGDLMFIAGGICVIWTILVRRGYLR